MKYAAARLPLTFAIGDSRNMAAQIDSEQTRSERTLYRSSDVLGRTWEQDGYTSALARNS